MKNTIIVFTLDGCSHCVELKTLLKNENMPFNEVEVEKNQEIWNKVVEQTGHNSLPTVYVSLDNGDSGPVFIPERDFTDKSELVEKLKLYV